MLSILDTNHSVDKLMQLAANNSLEPTWLSCELARLAGSAIEALSGGTGACATRAPSCPGGAPTGSLAGKKG